MISFDMNENVFAEEVQYYFLKESDNVFHCGG